VGASRRVISTIAPAECVAAAPRTSLPGSPAGAIEFFMTTMGHGAHAHTSSVNRVPPCLTERFRLRPR